MSAEANPRSTAIAALEAPPTVMDAFARRFFRFAASGALPARWFAPAPPPVAARRTATGRLSLEVVSHCWNYAHLQAYQLSSLVLHPPRALDVRMTVFYAAEDLATTRLLAFFSEHKVPGVQWNWQALPRNQLMRRSIGRNRAALGTEADWIWFTDCDLIFGKDCLDALAQRLQGRTDTLLYPAQEYRTALLPDTDATLIWDAEHPRIIEANTPFQPKPVTRATGPLQITHGDVARAVGYCNVLKSYQQPTDEWQKNHEDRIYRWALGTQGVPIDVPNVMRIRHATKGRYTGSKTSNLLRKRIRMIKDDLVGR